MERFFSSLWNSATKTFDNLADNADVIFFTFIRILLILIIAKLIIVITKSMTRAYIKRKKKKNPDSLVARKSETIAIVIQSIFRYTVYFFAVAAVLDQLEMGITAGSILATAGIGGVALGLGAQTLIKDVFSGFFLLFENQYAVGDFVQIREAEGIVEAITLRTTQFRKWTGEVIIVPNGTIDKVVNYTRGSMLALVVVYITRSEDIPKALSTMEHSCEEYAQDNPEVVEKPTVQGLLGLEETGFALRAIIKTHPMSQWKVEREAKLKIYGAFQDAGIEVPYPKRVVIEFEK